MQPLSQAGIVWFNTLTQWMSLYLHRKFCPTVDIFNHSRYTWATLHLILLQCTDSEPGLYVEMFLIHIFTEQLIQTRDSCFAHENNPQVHAAHRLLTSRGIKVPKAV